jgi:hypothetical protein
MGEQMKEWSVMWGAKVPSMPVLAQCFFDIFCCCLQTGKAEERYA